MNLWSLTTPTPPPLFQSSFNEIQGYLNPHKKVVTFLIYVCMYVCKYLEEKKINFKHLIKAL